jgi:hypothetical protein
MAEPMDIDDEVQAVQMADEEEEEDEAAHEEEPEVPESKLTFTQLAALKGQENREGAGWRFVAVPRKKKMQVSRKKKRQRVENAYANGSDVENQADIDKATRLAEWYKLEPQATEQSALTFLAFPGQLLLLILRWCTFGDIVALMHTCKTAYQRFSGKPTHHLDLRMVRSDLDRLQQAIAATLANSAGALELLRASESFVAGMCIRSDAAFAGSFNWNQYFQMASNMPIWPYTTKSLSAVNPITFRPMAKRLAQQWSAVESYGTARSLLSSGCYCTSCLRQVTYLDAMPLEWFRLKATGGVLCQTCMINKRRLRSLISFFSEDLSRIPVAAVAHDHLVNWAEFPRSNVIGYSDLDRQRHLNCSMQDCRGKIKLFLGIGGKGGRLGIGMCSNPDHEATFCCYEYKGQIIACPEQMSRFRANESPGATFVQKSPGEEREALATWWFVSTYLGLPVQERHAIVNGTHSMRPGTAYAALPPKRKDDLAEGLIKLSQSTGGTVQGALKMVERVFTMVTGREYKKGRRFKRARDRGGGDK